MDSFDIDNVKAEKANAMRRYRRLRKIASFFRFIEVCVALILASWFSTRLPIAVRISGEYFRDLCVVLVSPRFVFFVGNAIIITLAAKSGQFSSQKSGGNNSGTDFYDEYIKNSENRQKPKEYSPGMAPEEIVYQDKEVVREERTATHAYGDLVMDPHSKIYRRTQSEKLKRKTSEKTQRELRRSETERILKVESFGEKLAEKSYSQDGDSMSDEEFQRKVEAFIARQQQFLREESMAIVLHNHS